MLDDRELALSFLLSATCCFFWRRVISSTKVAGEAVLVISVSRVARMTETPFSTTRIALAPRLERRLFFLALILVYIPWLNFVVIPTRGEHLLKKKKKTYTHNSDEPNGYLLSFSSISKVRKMKAEGSGPRQCRAKVRGSTRSSTVFACSMTAATP